MSDECNFLGSVSSQQKFEAMDVKALGMSELSDRPCYSSRTDQCYSSVLQFSFIQKIKGKYRCEGMPTQKTRRGERECMRMRESETPGPLAPLFICFFFPLGLPFGNWASQECSLFYLRSSLRSSDLPLFYFCRLFSFLVFWPLPFWTPLSYSNYLTDIYKTIQTFSH